MNTYKITFTRKNGTVGTDTFIAATGAQARRDFHEVYRHGIHRHGRGLHSGQEQPNHGRL